MTVSGEIKCNYTKQIADDSPIDWPHLDRLAMLPDQVAARLDAIGGSDANIILSGDEEQILKLWRVKRREDLREPQVGSLRGGR